MPIPKACVLDNLVGKPKASDAELIAALRDTINQTVEEYLEDLNCHKWNANAWAEEFFTIICAVGEAFDYGLIQAKE